MKKIILLFSLSFILADTFAVDFSKPAPKALSANEIMIPVNADGDMMSLYELSRIKPREFAKISNRRMNLFDRAAFSVAQKKLRNNINADGTISNKSMSKFVAALDGETGFHIGGFALGFLLGLIGVLIAYLISDDYKSNRRKWAWIGFGSFVVLYILLVAIFA